MQFMTNHLYIFLSIGFAVASQLVIKWKMSSINLSGYESLVDKFIFAFSMLFNPFIMLSIVLTLLSGLSWMIAMTKFEISYAYPFTILGLVFVTMFSVFFFGESMNLQKAAGIVLTILGILVISRSL